MAERTNYGTLVDIVDPPDLIEIQTNSSKEFLQQDVAPSKRKRVGLQAVFREVFPIENKMICGAPASMSSDIATAAAADGRLAPGSR